MGSSIPKTRNPDEAEEDSIGPYAYTENNNDSLSTELRRYYHDYAVIPVEKRKRAKEVVEDIKNSLHNYWKNGENTPYTFGNIMPQGSIYEGLNIMEPDEFDLILPLMLKDNEWNYQEHHSQGQAPPGYFFIRKTRGLIMDFFGTISTEYDNCLVGNYLSSAVMKRKLQSVVQNAVDNMVQMRNINRLTLRESGSALTLEVRYDNSLRMHVRIVPAIKFGSKWFVAMPHPEADRYQVRNDQNPYNQVWRESYSEQERSVIRKMDGKHECRRACLKILKTIRLKNGSGYLGMLTSYHLKTCLMHLNYADPNADGGSTNWHQDCIEYRFKNLLVKLIRFLEDEKMPSFFAPTVDLFRNYDKDQLKKIRNWLIRIMRSDKDIIDELLSHRPMAAIGPNNVEEPLYQRPAASYHQYCIIL